MAKQAKQAKMPAAVEPPPARPLNVEDFRKLTIPLLNPSIRTSQAMIWFNNRLVVGTGRAPLGFMGRFTGRADGGFIGLGPDTGGRDQDGAQVVLFDPTTEQWDLVYDSPIITGRDGRARARDRSVRAAGICQTARDRAPTLYLGVGSLENNVVFLRSEDGQTYEECAGSGFGLDGDVPSVRNIVNWRGRVYSTPTGKNYGRGMFDDNMSAFPAVFESDDPLGGVWRPVSEMGFGRAENLSINELAVFNDHLYAATLNTRYGYELWKTDGAGEPPYRWTPVLERGAWRGPTSSIPSAMFVFAGALYIGGTIQRQGKQGRDRYGPFPAELVRVFPDDTWELVSGTLRCTPHGLKRPVSGLTGGFGDRYTHAFWRMASYDGYFYIGTAEWRWMPTYLNEREDLSEAQFDRLYEATLAYQDGAFGLWRSPDGVRWEAVTTAGFPGSSPSNYGVRELCATPHGLFVAPTAKQGALQKGGLELWWGVAPSQNR
jgi:hypothetical protein